jgi:predicted phosphodiesterase
MALAVLYDIHGNLTALEAVLAEAHAEGIDRWVLGGDYAAFGPWPLETLERLWELRNATWIRGNGERWLIETPELDPAKTPEGVQTPLEVAIGLLPQDEIDRLYALPESARLDGVLYVHGSPKSDIESFAPEPEEGEADLLDGIRDVTLVFGHSHRQFSRRGPAGTTLVNPGSVGMPLDGDVRAAWAIRSDSGDFEFRRTEYDVERAAGKARELGPGWGDVIAHRLERGSD